LSCGGINDILEQALGLALVDAKVRTVKTNVLIAPNLKPVLVDKIQIGQVRACYQYRKVSLVVRIDLEYHPD